MSPPAMRKVEFILSMCSGLMVATPFLAPALFPVAWIALIPLLSVLRKASLRRSFFCGWVTGIVTHLVGFYWLNYTISVFGGHSYATSALVFAGFFLGLPRVLVSTALSLASREQPNAIS